MGLELQSVEVSRAEDLDRAFSAVTKQYTQALVLPGANTVGFMNRGKIATFAQRSRLPAMYPTREYVEAGGLMFDGPSLPVLFRHAAIYVDKILKGANPAELPVEQPKTEEIRARHQPEDRQSPRPHYPAVPAAAGGSSHRMKGRASRKNIEGWARRKDYAGATCTKARASSSTARTAATGASETALMPAGQRRIGKRRKVSEPLMLDFDAFFLDHRLCGELDAGVVWAGHLVRVRVRR
jgi:ABC transporter substrate binding protein